MASERLKMRRSRHASRGCLLAAALGVGLAVTGCQAQAPSPSPEPTSSSDGSAAAADCLEIHLLSPHGDPIDLTGTWTTGDVESGNQVVYQLHQDGECLWGRAYSAFAGQEPAAVFDIVLDGTIRADFSIELELLELSIGHPPGYSVQAYPPFGRASMTLGVAFESTDSDELVTLSITDLVARYVADSDPGLAYLFAGNGPTTGQVLTRSP